MSNKTFIKLLSAVIMMSVGMCMTSCGGDDPKPTEPSEPKRENILAFDIVDGEVEVRCVSDTVTEVKIPSEVTIDGATYSVTTIAQDGFRNLASLKTLHVPSSIRFILRNAFYGTPVRDLYIEDLKAWCEIYFEPLWISGNTYSSFSFDCNPIKAATNIWIKGEMVEEDFEIPEGVTKIGQGAFTNLKYRRVKFPSTLEMIDFRAFQGCKNLDELSFGENLTEICNGSFYECGSLRSVTLPSSLEYLGFDAFHNEDRSGIRVNICSLEWWAGLKGTGSHETPYYFYVDGKELSDVDLTIPEDVTDIRSYAFYNMPGIRSVTFHDGVKSIGEGAFSYCKGLKELRLPSSLESIGKEAFRNCEGLESLVIPPCKLKRIEEYTFSNCTGLKTLYIPEPVEYIGKYAFASCSSLETITFPSTINELWWTPFDGCLAVKDIYIRCTTPPDSFDFSNSKEEIFGNIILHVPEGSLDIYRDEYPWKYFKEIVETKPEDFPTPEQY
jgi:hypothetical protein